MIQLKKKIILNLQRLKREEVHLKILQIKQKKKAWELIKESVPENINFGDACISKKHSNFFVNKNNASFDEMNSLINFVKKNVKDKTGININLEIKIIE